MKILIIILPTFAVTLILLRITLNFSLKNKIGTRGDAGRSFENISPRLGGIGLFVGFLTGVVLILSYAGFNIMEKQVISGFSQFTFYIISLLCIFILGLIDDLKGLNAWQKLPVEVIAASILFFNGFSINPISLPFAPGLLILPALLSYILTILWIVGITNAMNLIDGIDGLAGGIALISTVSFIILSILNDRGQFAYLALALIGPLIAFLIYNFYPSKLFMGDSGSLFLGFFLATLSLKASTKASFGISFVVPIIILFIPILDTILSFFRRIIKGKNPLKPDMEHIHHKLIENGNTEKSVFFIIMSWALVFSAIGVLSAFIPKSFRTILVILVLFLGLILVFYLKYLKFEYFTKIFNLVKKSDKNI